jgi:hypothetical protein
MRTKEAVRNKVLRVVVSAGEQAAIQDRACATGLTVSTYLRMVGLGYQPRSDFDLLAIQDLVQVNADLGRLGGLLKLWLTNKPAEGAPTFDVRRILLSIEKGQAEARSLMQRAQHYM